MKLFVIHMYISTVHESVLADHICRPQASCLCSENVTIGFKTSIHITYSLFCGKDKARTRQLPYCDELLVSLFCDSSVWGDRLE